MYPAGCQGCFLVQFAVGGIQNFLAIVVQESSGQGEPRSAASDAELWQKIVASGCLESGKCETGYNIGSNAWKVAIADRA